MRSAVLVTALLVMLVLLAACRPGGPANPTPTLTPSPPGVEQPSSPPATAVADLPDAPDRDPFDLARRYFGHDEGFDGAPLPGDVLYATEPLGSTRTFSVIDPVAPSIGRVDTTLLHVGDHALWYVANDADVQSTQIIAAARQFDDVIFPHVMETFAPGLELPGPIAIVTAPLNRLAGYFSASDGLPRSVYRHSNERVGVFMNTNIGTDTYLGTLAHEFQHVVHWLLAPAEDTWINEGLSEFAARSLDLPALSFAPYLRNPEVSPADWPEELGQTLPHYAGAAMFVEYLAHRTGVENIHRLIAHPANGLEGVQVYLEDVAPGLSFDEVFADWLVANLVGATDGPYAYPRQPGRVDVDRTVREPASGEDRINQLGAWYMRIEPRDGPLTFRFDGSTATPVLPIAPYSGEHCWWGNRGDNINSTLTRALDLTGVAEATLRFWMWHHIEEDWDHGYVAVSTNGGATWTALAGRHTTTDDPMSVTYGPAYTGRTEQWISEQMDLSPYAGQEVLLRFEYVTDEAVNTTGWCVDDIAVPEIGFFDDAESPDRGWEADGFIRLSGAGVQQRFLLRLVDGDGNSAAVTSVLLDARNNAEFIIERPATLVVTAMASKTSQPGTFTYEITR